MGGVTGDKIDTRAIALDNVKDEITKKAINGGEAIIAILAEDSQV